METAIPNNGWRGLRRILKYAMVTFLAGFILFIVLTMYMNSIRVSHDNEIALIVTIYLISGVYTGMYLSQIWVGKSSRIMNSFTRPLLGIMITCLAIAFFAAQFEGNIRNIFAAFLFLLLPLLVVSIGTGILFRTIQSVINRQLIDAKASAVQSKSELQFLQSQLSPHFLFNTLNNIYGIALSEHEKVPGLLLKLSSLLRYSVYDAREVFVPIKDELAYIRDYIQFEQLRVGDKLRVNTSLEEPKDGPVNIAPLLLIVFIENAFKHSKTTGQQPVFIDISLQYWNNRILFGIKNSCVPVAGEQSMVNRQSGFGLDNVKKRLELLYDNEHYLEISETGGYFQVLLQLKIK